MGNSSNSSSSVFSMILKIIMIVLLVLIILFMIIIQVKQTQKRNQMKQLQNSMKPQVITIDQGLLTPPQSIPVVTTANEMVLQDDTSILVQQPQPLTTQVEQTPSSYQIPSYYIKDSVLYEQQNLYNMT